MPRRASKTCINHDAKTAVNEGMEECLDSSRMRHRRSLGGTAGSVLKGVTGTLGAEHMLQFFQEDTMNILWVKNWWSMVVRGLVGISLGVITFLWPAITLSALVLLFGAYAILDGIVAFAGATQARRAQQQSGALVFEGVAGLIAGIITIARPAITATVLVYIVAAWAIITGILEISAAVRLRQAIQGEWLLGFFGVLSVLFGAAIAVTPALGALAIALWIGAYAFVSGIILTILGMRLRSRSRDRGAETRMAA